MLTTKNIRIVELGALSPSQGETHQKVADRLNETMDDWQIVTEPVMPPYREMSDHVIMGSFSTTDMVNKIKYIYPQHALLLPDVIKPVTPSQIARAYLWVKFGNKRHRMRSKQYNYMVRGRKTHPLYAMPQHMRDGVYVDIQSAYFTILKLVGLNPEYMPYKWLAKGESVEDFPYPGEKLARNMLVSSCLPGHSTSWVKGEIVYRKTSSSSVNLMLWSVVMDVLHTFARDMIKLGAAYVHTDGYIISRSKLPDVDILAKRWALPLGVKYVGECDIIGPAAYTFYGQHESRSRMVKPRPHSKIGPLAGDWLRDRIRKWGGRGDHMNFCGLHDGDGKLLEF